MPAILLPRLISCDEAGFTGNDMLNEEQPYFAYASHDLDLDEARALLREARHAHPVQMQELKANKLLKTPRGRDLLDFVLERVEGRYIATLYEKRLSLACKLYEYIYEPVLQANNALFYRNNLHRFVGMYLYIQSQEASLEQLASEFEAFMRSLDPAQAPTLFGGALGPETDPLIEPILRFARGYHREIAHATQALDRSTAGKWVLDLTTTAVFSQLVAWGARHPLIEVVCDDSKPLRSLAGELNVMINRPERAHVELFGQRRAITWNMTKPIAFAPSHTHAGVELADLIAGATAAVPRSHDNPELERTSERVRRHLHEDCILPNMDFVDLSGDEAPLNWLVLHELASRADQGADPLDGMEDVYEIGRQGLPEFHASRTPGS